MWALFWALLCMFLSGVAAHSFENIEADTLYDRSIKQTIQKEFIVGLQMLKAQADALNMQVREKDIKALQQYMYEKAYLIGRCADKAITLGKTVSEKIVFEGYVKGCVETHLKFKQELASAKWTWSMSLCANRSKIFLVSRDANKPYEFLEDEGIVRGMGVMMSAIDYVALKECFDKRTERDKVLDQMR